jgi:hypothetical protein
MAKKPQQPTGLAGILARPGTAARPAEVSAPAVQATAGAPKALTVKLTPELYRRLRMHAATHDLTHQAAMVTALVEYLDRHG